MPVSEDELFICSILCLVISGLILLSVCLLLQTKKRRLRRRQRRFYDNYHSTYGHRTARRKTDRYQSRI